MSNLPSITIENYKRFRTPHRFDFADLTFLVGPNSSGKSSLIKLLELFRKNVQAKKSFESLFKLDLSLLSDEDQDAIEMFSDLNFKNPITIQFRTHLYHNWPITLSFQYHYDKTNSKFLHCSKFSILNTGNSVISIEHATNNESLIEIDLDYFYEFMKHFIDLKSNELRKYKTIQEFFKCFPDNDTVIKVPGSVYKSLIFFQPEWNKLEARKPDLIWTLMTANEKMGFTEMPLELFPYMIEKNELLGYIKAFKAMSKTSINSLVDNDILNSNTSVSYKQGRLGYKYATTVYSENSSFSKSKQNLSSELQLINHFQELTNISPLISFINKFIHFPLQYLNSHFLTTFSFRGGQVTPRQIFNNLNDQFASTINEFNAIVTKYYQFNIFIREALTLLDLGQKIRIIETNDGISINIEDGDKITNISQLGYGVSQLISLIIHLVLTVHEASTEVLLGPTLGWGPEDLEKPIDDKSRSTIAETNDTTILIEEPETNLHPALQSKLADLLHLAMTKLNHNDFVHSRFNFVIETHSEYLIRKIQLLIAQDKLKPNQAVIYYFNPKDMTDDKGQVAKMIQFDDKGLLSEPFGPGFFDEADTQSMLLLRTQLR